HVETPGLLHGCLWTKGGCDMPSMRRIVFAIVAAAATAWIASARADDQVNVRFSWKLKGEYGPCFMAQEKGFFSKSKLSVRLGEGAGAPAALGALLQGQEDV